MDIKEIKIVFTDLDRTLLRDDNTFSIRNLNALADLKKNGIIVVIATGRNIFSARKVLEDDLSIDYLMFSAGCGIIDWKTKKVIYENHLKKNEIENTIKILLSHEVDFMVHNPIPDNHYFDYIQSTPKNPDFKQRIAIYKSFARNLENLPDKASQIIAILKQDEKVKFEEIKKEIDFLKIIRATSPLDHKSIWLEVFPNGVSKGHTAEWLCDKLKIDRKYTLGIGNDFNDLDLLEFAGHSCVVANAPEELKKKYNMIDSNQNDGFAKYMEKII
jgi:Cof subfamily protein (haloacid dehalogenase superfamily)